METLRFRPGSVAQPQPHVAGVQLVMDKKACCSCESVTTFVFPYLCHHSPHNNMKSLLDKVVAAYETIDSHILHLRFVQEIFAFEGDEVPSPFDYNDPEACLKADDPLKVWDPYFEHTLQQWDRDVDGELMSQVKYKSIIEQLSMPVAALDRYAPLLVQEYRKQFSVPERLVQGVLRRHSALNAFLNSADIGLHNWWVHEGT